ncbi:hypothetical protein BC938DRAFT_484243 [Jimgerdemannia flammicorona]|uniref:Uncharacterized protein n=1 Tax=Jimgerdemannia flammicorona TaxID=994334 RepID=A0A433QAD8_9FUNG|nr:hypothetical protein BC938DRAFT_484243 [Jimgerdemannia flammicorona]
MSKTEIAKHKKELTSGENNPLLVIIPNNLWIAQHGQPAYNAVMDLFATTGLNPPRRRDLGSREVFHFRNTTELFQVRRAIYNGGAAANAFHIPPALHAAHLGAQLQPIGKAWIIHKVGASQSDYGDDEKFFSV